MSETTRSHREQFLGQSAGNGVRVGGRNVSEGVRGKTADYRGHRLFGQAAHERLTRREAQKRRRARRYARGRAEAVASCGAYPPQTRENAAFWAEVKQLLDHGVGLDDAKVMVGRRHAR
jgi:hypothetical protein